MATLREIDCGCLKGVGHLVEVKIACVAGGISLSSAFVLAAKP